MYRISAPYRRKTSWRHDKSHFAFSCKSGTHSALLPSTLQFVGGYRSFLRIGGSSLKAGITPDTFAKAVIASFVDRELKGKLRTIVPLRRVRGL